MSFVRAWLRLEPPRRWRALVVGPAALIVANVLAAIAGRRAARLRISQILRAE